MSTAWGEPWPEMGAGVTRPRRDHQRAARSKWTQEVPVFAHAPHDPSVRLQPWKGRSAVQSTGSGARRARVCILALTPGSSLTLGRLLTMLSLSFFTCEAGPTSQVVRIKLNAPLTTQHSLARSTQSVSCSCCWYHLFAAPSQPLEQCLAQDGTRGVFVE